MDIQTLETADLSTATKVREFYRTCCVEDFSKCADGSPYVYLVVHKRKMDFYIGFRCANSKSPVDDLWNVYFSSSSAVRDNPSSF